MSSRTPIIHWCSGRSAMLPTHACTSRLKANSIFPTRSTNFEHSRRELFLLTRRAARSCPPAAVRTAPSLATSRHELTILVQIGLQRPLSWPNSLYYHLICQRIAYSDDATALTETLQRYRDSVTLISEFLNNNNNTLLYITLCTDMLIL